jgi:hypothetical protein
MERIFFAAFFLSEKHFMPGLPAQFVRLHGVPDSGRLSGVRLVVTIIGSIVVGVLLTPLAGWVA